MPRKCDWDMRGSATRTLCWELFELFITDFRNYRGKNILISKPCFSHLKYWAVCRLLRAGLSLVKAQVEVEIALNHSGSGFSMISMVLCMHEFCKYLAPSKHGVPEKQRVGPFAMSSVISLCLSVENGSRFLQAAL